MEETDMKKEYWSEVLTAALVLGLLFMAQLALSYVFKANGAVSWLLNIFGFAAIIWVLYHYGKRAGNLELYRTRGFSYGAAFGFSIIVLLISGILVGIAQWILQNVIDPQYYAELYRKTVEALMQSNPNIGEAQLKNIKATQEIMHSIWGMIGASMLSMILMGGFIALFTSAFVKRAPNPFADDKAADDSDTI